MIKIWHNPRCSKSREGLKMLEESKQEFSTFLYLKEDFEKEQLVEVLEILGISAIELVRTKEAIWKSDYKDKELTDDEIIDAMMEHPRLIERPIVIRDNQAVIGRPTEKILELLG